MVDGGRAKHLRSAAYGSSHDHSAAFVPCLLVLFPSSIADKYNTPTKEG